MSYASFCKRCGVIDRDKEVTSGILCDGCKAFTTDGGWSILEPPPGWLTIQIPDDSNRDACEAHTGQPREYVPDQNYCPSCAVRIRNLLGEYPLPYSRCDPARPT